MRSPILALVALVTLTAFAEADVGRRRAVVSRTVTRQRVVAQPVQQVVAQPVQFVHAQPVQVQRVVARPVVRQVVQPQFVVTQPQQVQFLQAAPVYQRQQFRVIAPSTFGGHCR